MKKLKFPKLIIPSVGLIVCIGHLPAYAQNVSVNNSAQYVRVGTNFDLSLMIDSLTASGAPSLGAYDFSLLYDTNLVSLQGNSLVPILSMNAVNSIFDADTSTLGQVNIFEVSLESAAVLNSSQNSSLSLGNLTFNAQNVGAANFTFSGNAFADADGNVIMPSFNQLTVMLVDRTSVNEFSQPLTGTILENIDFAELTQSCNHRHIKKLTGNRGNKGCLFAGGRYADSRFNMLNVNEDSYSYFGGGLVQLEKGLVFGGGLSTGNFDTTYRNISSIDDGDRFSYNGLVGWNFDPVVLTGNYSRTRSDGTIWTTHANLGGMISQTPFDVTSEAFTLQAKTEVDFNGIAIMPSVSVSAVNTKMDRLQETGADVLTVLGQSSSDNSVVSRLKLDFSKALNGGSKTVIRPRLGLGWQSTKSDNYQIGAVFTDNQGAAVPDIQANLDLIDTDVFTVEPGFNIIVGKNIDINVQYNGYFGSNSTRHVGSAAIRMVF